MQTPNLKNLKNKGKQIGGPSGGKLLTNILSALLIFLVIITAYSLIQENKKEIPEISLSALASDIQTGTVKKITIAGEKLEIIYQDKTEKLSKKELEATLTETLGNLGVPARALSDIELQVDNPKGFTHWALSLAPFLIPILFLVFFFWLLTRQVKGAGMQAFTFGQSKARVIYPDDKGERVTFKDVAGVKEAKEELVEIVDFLKNPKKFLDIGARIPKGVLLMGPPGSGKCITGDTRLLTQKGLVRIDEVPKYFSVNSDNTVDGLHVVTLDQRKLTLNETMASHWYDLGEQETIRTVTDSGVILEGTKEHPIIVVDKDSGNLMFRRLDEINRGDFIAISYNTQRFGSYTKIPSPDAAYLLGVLTGDGCLTIRNRIILSTADKEILDSVQHIARKLFGASFVEISSRAYDYEIRNKEAKTKILEWGLSETYAENKKVPEWILLAPKEYVTAYLRGLFDTDGSAERKGSISFSSSSKTLIENTQMMLFNLGIVARSYERKKKYNGKQHFYIAIYGDFVERFRDEVGFTVARKQKILEKTCALQRNTNINYIPCQGKRIGMIWKEAVASTSLNLNRAFYDQSLYKNTIRYIAEERRPSIGGMKIFLSGATNLAPMIATLPEVAYLRQLSSGQFFFTRVKHSSKGYSRVYDLTVPHTHNFIANGIINHNTLLARAVAGEARVPFFSISGSEFVEMFVGVGASRVRDLFQMAKKVAPSIIFVDEIDAVGRVRGAGVGGGNDEREQTLNQILVEMDGFEPHEKVIIISASNRPDVLDPALLRPGRFDRRVILDLPDINDREAILEIHGAKKPFTDDVKLRVIAERTPGFSGADLYSLMNEAAIFAARENRKKVTQKDITRAIEKVMLGPERKSHLLSKKEKKITAYHEAGHALAASLLPYADPVHKVSIISRGHTGGYTLKLPYEEKRLQTRKEFLDDIVVALGGYVAEKMVFDDLTTGPSSDLRTANALAHDMVAKYGMSEMFGAAIFEEPGGRTYLGRDGFAMREYSESVSAKIDAEATKIISEARTQAENLLRENRKTLDVIAEALIERETLEHAEFEKLLEVEGITPKKRESALGNGEVA